MILSAQSNKLPDNLCHLYFENCALKKRISVCKISTQDTAEQKVAAQQKFSRVVNMNLFKIIEYQT